MKEMSKSTKIIISLFITIIAISAILITISFLNTNTTTDNQTVIQSNEFSGF